MSEQEILRRLAEQYRGYADWSISALKGAFSRERKGEGIWTKQCDVCGLFATKYDSECGDCMARIASALEQAAQKEE